MTSSNLTGWRATFNGPLFGMFETVVLEDCGQTLRVVHPLTKQECVLPHTWFVTAVAPKGWHP